MLNELCDVKAVIFDMDGVLFLSSNCHEQAFSEVLAGVGITDFLYSSIAGMRTDEAFRKLFADIGKQLDDDQLDALVIKKREIALRLLTVSSQIAPGSRELISALRKKYILALASSASSQTVELFLAKSGYADAFKVVLDGSSVERAKPAPDIYLLAAQKLGVLPAHCIVVEDAVNGVQAAVAAGMKVIALTEIGKEKLFLNAGANAHVFNLCELL